nr:RagB/SusD family nutrient uptake outer membrane protein [Rhodohalobacter sp. 614A]
MNFFNQLSKILLVSSIIVFTSCDSILDVAPPDQLSETTFFQTESDARLALAGVYSVGSSQDNDSRNSFWKYNTYLRLLEGITDNGNEKDDWSNTFTDGTLNASNPDVENLWEGSYERIAKANNFLINIQSVEMNEDIKNEMIAEVKFLRAYEYFWLSQLWGGVPLVTEVLTLNEANSVSRDSKENVVSFVLNELTEASNNLPETRPASEHGRIIKSAALALKGRLLLAEENWSDAAATYRQVIDMGVHTIDPRWKALFIEEGETSNEIILSIKAKQNGANTSIQRTIWPFQYGGYHQTNVFANLLKDFEMIDGEGIYESPLYDPQNRYENRDPRLDMSFFIPERTVFKGNLYVAHPDSLNAPDRLPRRDWSGIALKKFADENYEGSTTNYGGDYPLIRYAEVLLSYLESMLESGQPITQNLLDETINKIRTREAVNMPPVTTTSVDELREIVRKERRVELAFEGLRFFDLLRWGIAAETLTGKFYGIQLTIDPDIISTGFYNEFEINNEGLFFYRSKAFIEGVNEKWPIPQSEIDINPNLEQNPGY